MTLALNRNRSGTRPAPAEVPEFPFRLSWERAQWPGPQKYVKQQPCGLLSEALGHYFIYFWGLGWGIYQKQAGFKGLELS